MRVGKIFWKDKTGEHQIDVLFVDEDGEEVVYWSLESLISKYIYQRKQITSIREYVERELLDVIRTKVSSNDGCIYIQQFDLDYLFQSLTTKRLIPLQVQKSIMRFLCDVPTPSAKEQVFDERKGSEDDAIFVPPPKGKEEEEEEYEEDEPTNKRKRDDEEEECENDPVEKTMVVCRVVETYLKLIDRNDIFTTDKDKSDARLFVNNLVRSIPKEKVLRYCSNEDLNEPEDDSPTVSVSSRIIQLGYELPSNAQQLLLEIGLLAQKYYRELHDGAYPPQVYRTYGDGTRLLVNKWTLNNCHNTLDRAIHTLMQK